MHLPDKPGDFVLAPSGSHVARCYRVIDLGTQQVDFQGEIKHQRKVLISWELYCDEKMDDGRAFTIGKRYTFSSSDKSNLRKDLESWRGRKFEDADFGPGGFSVEKLLGVACMLAVTHAESKGSIYANVTAVMGVPKGVTVPPLVNPLVFFGLEKEDFKKEVFETLSDALKKQIIVSPEYAEVTNPRPRPAPPTAMKGPGGKDDFIDDDIPF